MKFTKEQYAQALFESIHEVKAKDHDIVIANFIEVLRSNGDLAEYEAIVDVYEQYDRQQKGITQAVVTTAHELKQSKPILEELNKVAQAKIEMMEKIDDHIIGGVTIRMNDTLIDGSIRHQLEDLRDSLINPQS